MAEHMIWFLAAAVMVATVLIVGTLAAAEMMPWQRRVVVRAADGSQGARPARRRQGVA
jgi:hypothetical protein